MTKKTAKKDTPPAQEQPEQEWKTSGEADVWQPLKRGEMLSGKYVSSFHFVSKKWKKESTGYKIMTNEGMKLVFGTGRLTNAMDEVPEKSKIRITYLGRDKSAENDPHDWKVEYQPPTPF